MFEPVVIGGLIVLALIVVVVLAVFLVRQSRVLKTASAAQTATLIANSDQVQSAKARANEIIDDARNDAQRLLKDAELRGRDEALQRRDAFNKELDQERKTLREQEKRLEKREDDVGQQQTRLLKLEAQSESLQAELKKESDANLEKARELQKVIDEQTKKLYGITELSREQAEALLFERLEEELTSDVAHRIRRHEQRLKDEAEIRAREVITTAIQRFASNHTSDTTVSTVDIPDDTMKGRIIGREGRNIRTFEKCTGVDVIVDDTPGVVVVSAFDHIRRETARLALAKLIQDGRIHPTRIEEVVAETQEEMERHIHDLGRQAVLDANVDMPHEKIVYLLGRLQFRTSYSQNVLKHSLEVSHLCGLMAGELKLNPKLARRCGLLHDIGKAADQEMEGGHPKVGAELAKRYGETSKEVLHAIAGHHDDITIDNIYTVLVAAADAISASRPGARRETLERYVKRMEDLEAVACCFPEVETAYAIQAGRELRVIANANKTSDDDAVRICREIAQEIERKLDYPGEVRVTVIREKRVLDIAK